MAGLSQFNLGQAIGRSTVSIEHWEKGIGIPVHDQSLIIERLSLALGVSIAEIEWSIERTIFALGPNRMSSVGNPIYYGGKVARTIADTRIENRRNIQKVHNAKRDSARKPCPKCQTPCNLRATMCMACSAAAKRTPVELLDRCMDCNTILTNHGKGTLRCQPCHFLERSRQAEVTAAKRIAGLPLCLSCGKRLSKKTCKRCQACANKHTRAKDREDLRDGGVEINPQAPSTKLAGHLERGAGPGEGVEHQIALLSGGQDAPAR